MLLRNLTSTNVDVLSHEAAHALKKDGVVLYPTDTLYGLGAAAFSNTAVDKIYAIKGREENKPIHAIVSDLGMAGRYGIVDDRVRKIAEELPMGKLTFIVPKRIGTTGGILRGLKTFGFRIPDNTFCLAMIRAFGGPITATSANRSGEKTPNGIGAIFTQLGMNVGFLDIAVNGGDLPASLPSTVIDCTGKKIKILREGAVSEKDVMRALML